MQKTPDRVLFNYLIKADRIILQRKLSAVRDRDLAACTLYFSGFEKNILFSLLPPQKAERVKNEIKRNAEISYSNYKTIIISVIDYLKKEDKKSLPDSWFMPSIKRLTEK